MKKQFWKKRKWILPIIITAIVITTCTVYGKEDEENKEDEWNVDFEIERAEYIYNELQNEIEIYYPQLCGLEDSAKEERINALIEEDIMQILGEKSKEGDDFFYCVDYDYKIEFMNERIISIRYRGWDGYITTGHASLYQEVITTTIDIEEEKEIALQDVVTDLRELSDMLLAEEYESITLWEGEKTPFTREFGGTADELEENLREKPQEWYTDGENFIFVSMRTRYYQEYSISIESVGHILDAEFLKKLGKNAGQEGNSGHIENIVYEKAETINFENRYRILNKDIFENKTMIPWYSDETKQEIEDYAETVKGDLIEVWEEDSIFPQGLVIELENMIYQSLNRSMKKYAWGETQQSIYFETMHKLGAEKWHPDLEEMKKLFPELNDEGLELDSVYDAYQAACGSKYCYDLFHIPTSDRDYYVLAIDSGGSAGICYIELTELVNGEFVKISEFETSNAGWGTVIQYEDDFYYIFLENNYSMKIYDGVRVYKLGENMEYENIQIKHLPDTFVRKNLYNTSEGRKLDSYIEDIWEEITSDKYLDNGTDGSGFCVYFGDEEEAEDFTVPKDEEKYNGNKYYQIDFANMGIPIYMRKSIFTPPNYYTTLHIRSPFYLRNPLNDSIVTLRNMELDPYLDSRYPIFVQMWFKEMDGKVYTFCLYHVSDYNYMLNVVRIEGNQVNRIRTDILSPRRSFVLTEGERALYG